MNRFEKYVRFLGRDDPGVRRLLELAELRPEMRKNIEARLVQIMQRRVSSTIDLPPFTIAPPNREYHRPFLIGQGLCGNGPGYDYFVDLDSFEQSGSIPGSTGMGKSTLAEVIAIGVANCGGRAIFLDSMHEHHKLIHAFKPGEVLVLELGKSEKENPLQPPGNMSPEDWKGIQKNILREQFLRDGSLNLHDDIMHRAYKAYGVYDGGENYPTIKRILSGALEKTDFKLGTRSYGFKESLTDRLRTLGNIPSSFDVIKGYDLPDILRSTKIVIFRLGHYSADVRLFYVNVKLEKIRQCLAQHPGEFGRVIIVLEESCELISNFLKSRSDITEPTIYRAIRQFRRYGASFLVVDQFAGGIPDQIWSCFNNIFVMRQSDMKSMWTITKARNLDEEQAEFLSRIPPRVCIHCPADDAPRLIEITDLNLPPVSEEELDDYMAPLLQQLKYVPDDGSPPPVVEDPEPSQKVNIKRIDRQVLEKVIDHPFGNVARIAKLMGDLSPVIAKNILKKLEDQGYVESFHANLGFGRPKKLYLVSESGAELLGEDYQRVKPKGKGSPLHRAAQHLIADNIAEQGLAGFVEYHSADVAEVIGNGRVRAYEIELLPHSGDIPEQIVKDLELGFSEIVVLTVNKEGLKKVRKRVEQRLLADSKVGTISDTEGLMARIRFDLIRNHIKLG
ncbi:MAG: helicase HerA domain-containing protein [Candidatus Zixiibacteriota bacterium]